MDDFEFVEDRKQDQQITINKSTYNRLIIIIISAAIISAFLGGYVVGGEMADPKEVIIREIVQNSQTGQTTQTPSGTQIIKNVSIDDDPMKGSPDAEITIIEFSDFQCPFCWRFYTQTLPLIEENYISTGKVNFVYRDFPITGIHPNAVPAALAGECADDQGKFWEIHDVIFINQKNWQDLQPVQSANLFREYAFEIGLNMDEFDSCMSSGKHLGEIQNDLDAGRAYGVTGTPGFFVGNEKIGFTKIIGAQPFSSFQKLIEQQLAN